MGTLRLVNLGGCPLLNEYAYMLDGDYPSCSRESAIKDESGLVLIVRSPMFFNRSALFFLLDPDLPAKDSNVVTRANPLVNHLYTSQHPTTHSLLLYPSSSQVLFSLSHPPNQISLVPEPPRHTTSILESQLVHPNACSTSSSRAAPSSNFKIVYTTSTTTYYHRIYCPEHISYAGIFGVFYH